MSLFSFLAFIIETNCRSTMQDGPLKCEACDALIIINDLEGKLNTIFSSLYNFI